MCEGRYKLSICNLITLQFAPIIVHIMLFSLLAPVDAAGVGGGGCLGGYSSVLEESGRISRSDAAANISVLCPKTL